MDYLKILARILGVSVDKIKAYAEAETGEEDLVQLNADNLKKKFDEGHQKATKLALKELAAKIADDLDIDVKGSTPDDIAASIKSGIEGRGADEVTEEAVKGSEVYKSLQAELLKAQQAQNKDVEKRVKEALKEKDAEYKKELRQANRKAINAKLFQEAEAWLTANKAVLHEDPVRRRKQIQELVNKLDGEDVEVDEDGNYLFSKSGQPVTNSDGHNAKPSDRFSEYDYLFRFQEVDKRQSSGLPPGGSGAGNDFKHFKGTVPKTEEEMNKLRTDRLYGSLSSDALKEVEAAFIAQSTSK